VPDEAEQAVQEGFTRIDAAIADFSNPDSDCDPELLEAAERAIADPSVNAAAQEALSPDGNAALDKSASAPGHAPLAPPVAAAPNTQEPER